jgi:hypothetical protein
VIELLAVELPRTFQFLQPGWLALHLVAIPVIFVVGMAVGRRKSSYPGTYPST